jgi:adenylate cyclase
MSRVVLQTVLQGQRREFPLEERTVCRIGRGEQSTIVLSGDIQVSRNHAVVQHMNNGEYYLTDLSSRNGTLLNGRLVVSPTALRNGDIIRMGGYEFVFVQEEDAAPGAPPPTPFEEKTTVAVTMRLMSVLVIDIRNFTGLTMELGESRTTEMMGSLFHAAGVVLSRNGSYAQKYIGDAVMAVWVHEGDRPVQRDLLAVFHALMGLAEIIGGLQAQFALRAPLCFGAGINSGVAALGNLGSAGLADHTAMGECVNKAFRLETASKELGVDVVVGRDTFGFLDTVPEIREILQPATANLKGYAGPEPVYVASLEGIRRALAKTMTIS